MTDEQAMGMWMGLFIGDAAGVPYEFMPPSGDGSYQFFSSGGAHNAGVGEWSDDGAMALAIANAYISERKFCATTIQKNFVSWLKRGTFGSPTLYILKNSGSGLTCLGKQRFTNSVIT